MVFAQCTTPNASPHGKRQVQLDNSTKLHRLEQQLSAFEKLHKNELAEFERKLAIFQQLQKDEVELLHKEVTKLKALIESQETAQTA